MTCDLCVLCREYWEAQGGKDDAAAAAAGEKPHRSNKERTVIVDGYQVRACACVGVGEICVSSLCVHWTVVCMWVCTIVCVLVCTVVCAWLRTV